MEAPQSASSPPHQYPQAIQLKLYQAFIFSIPILFSIILFLLFYLFYLKRRASGFSSTSLVLPRTINDVNVTIVRIHVIFRPQKCTSFWWITGGSFCWILIEFLSGFIVSHPAFRFGFEKRAQEQPLHNLVWWLSQSKGSTVSLQSVLDLCLQYISRFHTNHALVLKFLRREWTIQGWLLKGYLPSFFLTFLIVESSL